MRLEIGPPYIVILPLCGFVGPRAAMPQIMGVRCPYRDKMYTLTGLHNIIPLKSM